MALQELFANQPATTVSSGGTDAPSSGTVESWTVASSSAFPSAATGSSQFHVADTADGFTSEIIAVTNVNGTTWTVTRGAESTTPVAHTAGFTVQQVVTAGWLGTLPSLAGDLGGTTNAPTVTKIQGTSISPPSGTSTKYLNGQGDWTTPSGGGGSSIPVVAPSGDETGATDVTNINDALASGGFCQLLAGIYYVNAPLTPTASAAAPYSQNLFSSALVGCQPGYGSDQDNYSVSYGYPTGTVINATDTFAGNAVILMDNESSDQYVGPYIANLYVNCLSMPAQSGDDNGHGIAVIGPWGAGRMENVTVFAPQGSCFVFQDANTGSGNPDEWVVTACKASGAQGSGDYGGFGWFLEHCPDSVFEGCNGSACEQDAWLVGAVTNSQFIGCKGENSGSNGWHMVGFFSGGEMAVFAGCQSNENYQNGYLFDDANGSGLSTYVLTGCKATYDSQETANTYSGFLAGTCSSRVLLTGCYAENGYKYGVSQVSSYYVYVVGGYYAGTTSAFNNGSGNTHALGTAAVAAF